MTFWETCDAWCTGRISDAEFRAAQLSILGFIWIEP